MDVKAKVRVSSYGHGAPCPFMWAQQAVPLLLLTLFLTACSGCNKTTSDTTDTSTDTNTITPPCPSQYECIYLWNCEPAGGITHENYTCEGDQVCCEISLDGGNGDTGTGDTAYDDTDTWPGYTTDAGVWEWTDLPEVDGGSQYQQLSCEGATGGDDYDMWEDLMVYVDKSDNDFSIATVVDVKNRKKIRIPFVIKGCVENNETCWQEAVTIYDKLVFYRNAHLKDSKITDQVVKVDLDKKTQQIIWSRKWPDGDTLPAPYHPEIWGNRLVYMSACDFIEGRATICLFESPWLGKENQSVIYDQGSRGNGRKSMWDDILVVQTLNTVDHMSQDDILGYNLNDKTWFTITDHEKKQYAGRIHGNHVVWMDWRHSNSDGDISNSDGWKNIAVYAKDIKTNEEWKITDGSSLAVYPDVFNDVVVWLDYRHCSGSDKQELMAYYCAEVYGYNLVTKKGPVRISNWEGSLKQYTRIWGDRIFLSGTNNGFHYFTYDVPEELKTP